MTEQTQENVTTPAQETSTQENAEQNPEQKKRVRRTKEQRLAELQRKAAKLEKDLKKSRRDKQTHEKAKIGGWIVAAMRRKPEAVQRALKYIAEKADIDTPQIDWSVLGL